MKFEYEGNVKVELFKIISTTAIIANTIGFTSNYFLFGMGMPTLVCLFCALSMVFLTIIGKLMKSFYVVTVLILTIINVGEFPYLYYIYGNSTIVYMVLGFIGTVIYCSRKNRWKCASALIIFDVMIIYCSFIFHKESWQQFNTESIMGSTFCSLVIVMAAVYSIIVLWTRVNEKQEKELLKLNEELKHMAQIDALTKVYNRRYLTEYLERLIEEPSSSFGIALIDIDNFKMINDTYGHVFGDEVLTTLCEIMRSEMNNTDNIFRYGGEEFFLVFHNLSRIEIEKKLDSIAEKFRRFSIKRKNKAFSFSGGVGFYNDEDNITKIYNKVDAKLYEAKNSGKNVIIWN